jgi:ferrous iron transport protein A
MSNETTQALSDLPVGKSAVITEFYGGKGFINRLASLGLTPGVEILMVQNYRHGPIITLVRGVRVAIGRTASSKVWVERHNNEPL